MVGFFKWCARRLRRKLRQVCCVLFRNVAGCVQHWPFIKVQIKVKFTLEQATNAHRGSRGIATLFTLTSALDGMGGQRHAPAALPPVMTPYL